jgi:hypothetical protein
MLTMAGLGLVTGVTLGAGPAMAATSADQGSTQSATKTWGWGDDDHVIGFFPSWFSCNRAGEWGDDEGWWDDYFCVRTHDFDDRYALVVQNNHWGHGWHGNWGNHHVGQWWSGNNWNHNNNGGGNNWWWWHHKKNKGGQQPVAQKFVSSNGNPFGSRG